MSDKDTNDNVVNFYKYVPEPDSEDFEEIDDEMLMQLLILDMTEEHISNDVEFVFDDIEDDLLELEFLDEDDLDELYFEDGGKDYE